MLCPSDPGIRSSGQFGARVEVPDGADTQTRMLGFIGRDPFWPRLISPIDYRKSERGPGPSRARRGHLAPPAQASLPRRVPRARRKPQAETVTDLGILRRLWLESTYCL